MATTKLTLSMEPEIVNRAKQYAKKRQISLSRLIQDFLDEVSKNKPEAEGNIPADILSITGILKDKFPNDVDLKEERYQYLKEKYGL
jgi:hypothetical protein